MRSVHISPEEIDRVRAAAEHHNAVLRTEIITPEFLAEALKLIDERIAAKQHAAAMEAIEARRRKAEIYANRNVADTQRRALIIIPRTPRFLRRHVKASNSSDDDDHDSNLWVNTPRGPAFNRRGPVFFVEVTHGS